MGKVELKRSADEPLDFAVGGLLTMLVVVSAA
jgi:hypothetical protein